MGKCWICHGTGVVSGVRCSGCGGSGAETGENPKDTIGSTKPPLHLIPPAAEIVESMVMKLGAEKYGSYSWRKAKVRASVYVSAARRHLLAWFDGQDNDPESGLSHLGHARACMGILLDAGSTGNLADDRPVPGVAAKLIEKHTRKGVPTFTHTAFCNRCERRTGIEKHVSQYYCMVCGWDDLKVLTIEEVVPHAASKVADG